MRAHNKALIVVMALIAALVVTGGFGTAADEPEEKADQAEKKPAEAPAPKVFTNEDLERMFGPPSPPPAPPEREKKEASAEKKGPDAIRVMQDQQARARGHRQLVAGARAEVAAAERRVKTLENRLLAIRNPLRPRPQLSDKEAEAWKGLDGTERVELTNKELEEARKTLEEAKKRLDALLDKGEDGS
jgi:hypothetical protein